MVYIRDGIIAKRLENLESKHSETIYHLQMMIRQSSYFLESNY